MTAAQHPESAQRNSTPAPTPPQHHPRPEAKLDQLPVELLRLVITHLDPPAKLSWAALSTHLRTVLLIASEDLIVHDCKKWVGWWWRPFGTAQGQAWAQLIRVVAERACPVCRLMPPLEVDKATERDAGGGHAAAEMVRPRANAGLTESMRGPRRRQHRRARAKEREAYVADTISSSSDDQSRHCPASSPMTASLFAALPIRPHILLPHVRACRTCLTTHPSYALITANTASQRFGLDALALQELARSSPPGDSHVRLFQIASNGTVFTPPLYKSCGSG
ncbi:hypothetical protein V8E36_001755 [Tilletia maclaganii]